MPYDINSYLVHFVSDLNHHYETVLSSLADEQLYHVPNDRSNHIVFNAWHWLRTEDNILNFVFQDRKSPLWLRQELHEKWDLPKVAQGTGMPPDDARALRVPSGEALAQYSRDVLQDVLPYLQSASADELATVTKVVPWGELPKVQHLGQVIIAHGYGHLGQIDATRAALGLETGDI